MSLTELIQSADLVVLPYDSRDQVTSGVLVDAVAAGRPVVSTAFPHAVELLGSGAGIVVPQRDPVALGRAIRSVLTDPSLCRRWRQRPADSHPGWPGPPLRTATPNSPTWSWPLVGRCRRDTAHVRARAVHERRDRDVRTRRSRRTTSRRGVLHRRRRPVADRRRAGAGRQPGGPGSGPHGLPVPGRGAERSRQGPQSARRQGRWHGRHGVEDCWGRSVWAFGTAAPPRAPRRRCARSAISYFDHGSSQRSRTGAPWPSALGAAEVANSDQRHRRSRELLADAIHAIGRPSTNADWPWPEPRLSYANAALAEALIAAGDVLDRPDVVDDGLLLLRWLLDRETSDGHLSPTPVGGAGPGDTAGRFDQQPIEVAALADACHRAHVVTGDSAWQHGVDLAIAWFAGDNDLGAVMWDPDTHGCYDGLTPTGPNLNQGAESTLALIATLQYAARNPEGATGLLMSTGRSTG